MARLRSGFSPRGRSSGRRTTVWGVGTGGVVTTTISGTGATFVGSAIQATEPSLTVIRQRGYFSVQLLLATAADDSMNGAFGIGIVEDPAFTAGIASVPTPISEAASENWLYWQAFSLVGQQVFAAGGAPGAEMFNTFHRFEIDSKAMRKMDTDKVIYAALEVTEVGTANVSCHHDSRMLFKLP